MCQSSFKCCKSIDLFRPNAIDICITILILQVKKQRHCVPKIAQLLSDYN